MFLRVTGDINYYLRRGNYTRYFDEHSLSKKTRWYISRVERKINDKNSFTYFKYWVLWRWININFKLSEHFIYKLHRNIKKLRISINAKEEKFIRDLEELVFSSWRPLKELPVRFELDKKEKINLIQTGTTIYNFDPNLEGRKIKMIGKYDVYFSNTNIYLTDENQKVEWTIKNDDVTNSWIETYGVVIVTKNEKFLFRGKNRLLSYILLQRMIPRLNLKIESVPELYNYFDFWNPLSLKIS